MADHNEIVDQIRAFLQSSDQTLRDFLPGLATAYAEACADVNRRLLQCDRLLQKGLRSEAIHLAETGSNLLQSLSILDFPERAEWESVVDLYQLTAAPPLSGSTAEFLNAAYAEEDPLKDLMRQHRRFALARAPLPKRLEVMRKISTLDRNNPVWNDDIRAFEKARLLQVQGDAAEAAQRRDLPGLLQIVEEMEKSPWSEPPPASLVQVINNAAGMLRKSAARKSLVAVEFALNEAFATMDAARGREARRNWKALIEDAALPPNDSLHAQAGPALQWLSYEDRREKADKAHQTAVIDLEEALDDGASLEELERLGHAVSRDERGMPANLEPRLRLRMEELKASGKLRRRVILTASALGVVLASGLTFAIYWQFARAAEVKRRVASFDQILQAGELEQATGYLDKLADVDPGLAGEAPLLDARARLREAQSRDDERSAQFAHAMTEAEASDLEQSSPSALATAQSLARLPREKSRIEQFSQRRAIAQRQDRAHREETAGTYLKALDRKVERLEALSRKDTNPGAVEVLFREVKDDLDKLTPQLGRVDDSVSRSIRACVVRFEAVQIVLEQHRKSKKVEEEITRAIEYSPRDGMADSSRFTEALLDYIDIFPNSPRAVAMKKTVEERPGWDSALAYRKLAASWQPAPTRIDLKTAPSRAEQCRKFLEKYPNYPDAEHVLAYQNYAESFARREDARKRLSKLFTDSLIDEVYVIQVSENGRSNTYYLTKKPAGSLEIKPAESLEISYLAGFDGREKVKNFTPKDANRVVLSPQSQIASFCKKRLADDSILTSWESTTISLAEQVSRSPDLDPLLKLSLYDKIMSCAGEGSEPLKLALAGHKKLLERGNLNLNVAWMDPDDAQANRSRKQAQEVVRSFPAWTSALKAALELRAQIDLHAAAIPLSVGWLKTDEDDWKCQVGGYVPPRGDLWVIVSDEAKKSSWKHVAAIAGGKIQIDDGVSDVMAEGRPVFLMKRDFDKP